MRNSTIIVVLVTLLAAGCHKADQRSCSQAIEPCSDNYVTPLDAPTLPAQAQAHR